MECIHPRSIPKYSFGIVVQLILIPAIMVALKRAKVVPFSIGNENKEAASQKVAQK